MDANKRLFLILVVAVPVILLLLYIAKFGQAGGQGAYDETEPPYPKKQVNDAVREYM